MTKLSPTNKAVNELLKRFRSSIPPDAMAISKDQGQVAQLAVLLGVLDTLQREAPGPHSNIASRHYFATDTVFLIVRSYGTNDPKVDGYTGIMIELAPLRQMPGGMELVSSFMDSFFRLAGGVPQGIWDSSCN